MGLGKNPQRGRGTMDIAVFMLKTAIEVTQEITHKGKSLFHFLSTFPHLICHSFPPDSLSEHYHTFMEYSQVLISHSSMEYLS